MRAMDLAQRVAGFFLAGGETYDGRAEMGAERRLEAAQREIEGGRRSRTKLGPMPAAL